MRRIFKAIAAVTAMMAMTATGSSAHDIKAGDLTVTGMWTRATPGGAKVAGGYFTVTNTGPTADRIVAATSPASGKVEIHEMATTNGVMTMRPLDNGLAIEAGKSVTLAPGGLHLMLTDLKEPLKEGGLLPITLQFEKAGKAELTLHIRPIGAPGPTGEVGKGNDAGHDHSKTKM